jgi:arginine decarboxylase
VVGYRAADWLRDNHRINLHLSDHRRISAQLTHADDANTATALVRGLRDLAEHASNLRSGPRVRVPDPDQLGLELVRLPRDAFFGRTDQVPADEAVDRISAEMLTPYPPGIPTILPGERITEPVMTYLRTGVAAGMVLPDASDPHLNTVRVLCEE